MTKFSGKVLVTGGAGFIGSHLVRALVDRGDRVVVVDDLSTGFEANVPQGVEFHAIAAQDIQKVPGALVGVSHVYHLAAMALV